MVSACLPSDVQSNGWLISNSASISGNRVDADVSQCVVSQCNNFYKIDNKMCAPKLCSELTENEISLLNYNLTGATISGTYPACSLSCNSTFQELAANGKSCIDKIPNGSISFAQDYTKNLTNNVLNITQSNAQQIQFYSDAGCVNPIGAPQASSSLINVTVPAGDGIKHAYAKLINGSVTSSCLSDSIILDQTLPSISYNISSDYTIPNPENASSKTYTYTRTITEVNLDTESILLFNQPACSGTGVSITSLSNLVVNRDSYISIQVTAVDKAGNISQSCSPTVYLTQPELTAIEFENNPASFAIGKKLQPRKIQLKDQYNQVYTRTSHTVVIKVSGSSNVEVPVVNGESLIYLTNNSVATKVGATLIKIAPSITSIQIEVKENPSKYKVQSVTAYRKNCSELKSIDNLSTTAEYTLDFDEEGPLAPVTAVCHLSGSVGYTLYASFMGNNTITQGPSVLSTDTKYLQQTSFNALKANPYAFMIDFNGATVFALNSDIPNNVTPCQDLRNTAEPAYIVPQTYIVYGHYETSGCNGSGGDYTGVFWDRIGTTNNTDVDGRATTKIWRIGSLTNPITTTYNLYSNNNYLRAFIANTVYQYPYSCADALSRDSTLLNSGTSVSYMIDIDGIGGLAPINATCDFNTSGGGWTLVVDDTPTLAELALFGSTSAIASTFTVDASKGVSWGTSITNTATWTSPSNYPYKVAMPHSRFKITYSGSYNSPLDGLGVFTIYNLDLTAQLLALTDGHTDASSGQTLYSYGNTGFSGSQTNVVNRTDEIVYSSPGLNFSMNAFTSAYGYTRRYFKNLWLK